MLEVAERWRVRTQGAFDPGAVRGAPGEGPLWRLQVAEGVAERRVDRPVSLNALAKGYIVDRAGERAVAIEGVVDVLVNIGGDLRIWGPTARSVAIADPRTCIDNAPPLATLRLCNRAVASSGSAWRSHLIDPRTGDPLDPAIGAAVVAESGMDADALATACCVLDPDAALALVESVPEAACLRVGPKGGPWESARWKWYAVNA